MLKGFKRPDDGLDKASRKAEAKRLQEKLTAQQMLLRDAKLPVIVLVEGWSGAGKGGLINDLISEIDPRFSSVFLSDRAQRDADRYPFLYPFFGAIPEEGKLQFMDGGWMEAAVRALCAGESGREEFQRRIRSVNRFERQLRDNGYLVLKLFLNISREEQKARLNELRGNRDTAWRVTNSFSARLSCESPFFVRSSYKTSFVSMVIPPLPAYILIRRYSDFTQPVVAFPATSEPAQPVISRTAHIRSSLG